jgi:hypothetical protein
MILDSFCWKEVKKRSAMRENGPCFMSGSTRRSMSSTIRS